MGKISYYVLGLKPSIGKEMLEGLRRMYPNVRPSHIDITRIAAAKGRTQRATMAHTQLQQSMNTKTRKKGLPTLMLGDTPDAPFTGSDLPKDQFPEFYLHPLDTLDALLKLEKVLRLESIPTTDDHHKSLPQQGQSGPFASRLATGPFKI